MTTEPILVSIREVGRMLGFGRTTIYRMIGAGQLDRLRLGRRSLIRLSSIRALAGDDGGNPPTRPSD